jgi:hypothetical protein
MQTTVLSLFSRSRSKLEEIQKNPKQKSFMNTELICLLNSAAVDLKRMLFRDALERCEQVRASQCAEICR